MILAAAEKIIQRFDPIRSNDQVVGKLVFAQSAFCQNNVILIILDKQNRAWLHKIPFN
jgi:hypothetical protein